MATMFYDEGAERQSWAEGLPATEELLRQQLKYVYDKSPFYRKKFDAAGIKIANVRTAQDFAKLPFTYKHELRESQQRAPAFGEHCACPDEAIRRIYSTSGTTGVPTFIGLTSADLNRWLSTGGRALAARGISHSHRVINFFGAGPFVGGISGEIIHHYGACLIPLGPGHTDRVISACRVAGARVIQCTPSYAFYLADHCRTRGIDPRSLGIELLLPAGEPGGGIPAMRVQLEEAFGCRVLESMGNGDAGMGIWSECEEGTGMHFMGQGLVYPEIIDFSTGEVLPVQAGTEGELVYTTVNRECVPLIRFRTRDHVAIVGTECRCGRQTMRIRCIGRYDHLLIVRGVNVYPSAIEDVVASIAPRTTGRVEILLPEKGPRIEPPVRLKVEHAGVTPPPGLATEIETLLKEKLVFAAKVELVPEGTLGRGEYKRKVLRVEGLQ